VANAPARLARAQRQSVLAAEQGMAELGAIGAQGAAEPGLRTVPYSIVVHAYSNLTLEAQAQQSGFAPGGRVNLTASLAQSGIPLEGAAHAWAEVTAPAGTTMTVAFPRKRLVKTCTKRFRGDVMDVAADALTIRAETLSAA
jgi:hypothetical protein